MKYVFGFIVGAIGIDFLIGLVWWPIFIEDLHLTWKLFYSFGIIGGLFGVVFVILEYV